DGRLRQIKPELHRRFDLLNDGSVYRTQRPLQFHDRNTADSLRVKSPGFQTACMMWNFKTITPKSGRARNVTHYRALMIQIDNAENETRTRFLGHAQVNYPQFSASRLRHDFSSRSYMANISADAPIIRRYSSNQADNSDNSVGESCSIAFSISATVLMRRKLPSHILTGKFIPLRLIPSLSAFSHLFSHVQLRPRRVFLRRLHHGFDEGHAAHGVLDLGIVERGIVLRQLPAFEPGADVVGEVFVDVRE